MGNRLFVGGLSWDTDSEGLQTAFAEFGQVEEAVVVNDPQSGRSRGFGFVTFSDRSAATAAVEAMDGRELDGRRITVNEAKPRPERGSGNGGGGGGRGPRGGGGRPGGRGDY